MSKVNLQLNRYLYRLVNSFEALIKGIFAWKRTQRYSEYGKYNYELGAM